MRKQLVICDRDERYRQNMQTYLMKRLKEFEVLTFASLQEAAEYSRKKAISILLIGEQLYEEGLQEIQALQTFILREDGEKVITEYPYLEKYQSMECLIRDILEEYAGNMLSDSPIYQYGKRAKVHTFYSPVCQEQQTKAALALGQLLAQEGKKVLYLNLQAFAGVEEPLETDSVADITDLLYFVGKQEGNLKLRLLGMKQTMGGVDYLPPAADYLDILRITEAEWMTFLDMLMEIGDYSDIILDLSEICQGLYRILERSNQVYSVCGMTERETYSTNQYKRLLEKRELSSILKKTSWMELPRDSSGHVGKPERLHATPLGEYMKGLMKENGDRQI